MEEQILIDLFNLGPGWWGSAERESVETEKRTMETFFLTVRPAVRFVYHTSDFSMLLVHSNFFPQMNKIVKPLHFCWAP